MIPFVAGPRKREKQRQTRQYCCITCSIHVSSSKPIPRVDCRSVFFDLCCRKDFPKLPSKPTNSYFLVFPFQSISIIERCRVSIPYRPAYFVNDSTQDMCRRDSSGKFWSIDPSHGQWFESPSPQLDFT